MIELAFAVVLTGLACGVGTTVERRHYKRIRLRESASLHVPVATFKTPPAGRRVSSATLAVGSVVISVDYYKRFLARLRMFFGGELKSYSSLLDRARREAVLRMKESCPQAEMFINFRFETASISKGRNKAIGSVEVLAYSTALQFADEVRSEAADRNG
jgi:uncharacterized protein YbjQ (UPF0145 family)